MQFDFRLQCLSRIAFAAATLAVMHYQGVGILPSEASKKLVPAAQTAGIFLRVNPDIETDVAKLE